MELQEQVNALTAENKQLKEMLQNVNLEKIALDKMLIDAYKDVLAKVKIIVLNEENLRNMNAQLQNLLNEKEALKEESIQHIQRRDELQAKLDHATSQETEVEIAA